MTEQYAAQIHEPILGHVTSDFFQTTTAMKVPLNHITTANSELPSKDPPRKRAKSKPSSDRATSKPKSKKAKSTKSKPIAEKLLSPTSALLRMNRQEILFGTSSQLALEESPTTIRQLQFAMKTSEEDAGALSGDHTTPTLEWPKLGGKIGRKGLWGASARNDEGGIFEHTDMVCVPEPDRTPGFPLLTDDTHDEIGETPTFIDIDDTKCSRAVLISSDLPTPSRTASPTSPLVNIVNGGGQTEGSTLR